MKRFIYYSLVFVIFYNIPLFALRSPSKHRKRLIDWHRRKQCPFRNENNSIERECIRQKVAEADETILFYLQTKILIPSHIINSASSLSDKATVHNARLAKRTF